jgi:hypothetical protein
MKFQLSIMATAALLIASGCAKDGAAPSSQTGTEAVTPKEAAAIAEEAYIYAFPMMENYRTMYVQAIDRTAPGYGAPFNEFAHKTELLGPEFKDIVRPNNDTMYSFAWLDLRAQPIVITVPEIKDRYYSVQLVDMFTHNFGYIGTRATGTEAGSYVVAGPQWEGTKPGDAKAVFRSESNFVYCIIRTEVDGLDDVAAVVDLQKQYRLTAMNVFLGRSRVPVAAGITFPAYDPSKAKSAAFIDLLNFLLMQVVIVPEEQELMSRFSAVGIQAGALSASLALTPELRDAVDAGVGQGVMARARSMVGRESTACSDPVRKCGPSTWSAPGPPCWVSMETTPTRRTTRSGMPTLQAIGSMRRNTATRCASRRTSSHRSTRSGR